MHTRLSTKHFERGYSQRNRQKGRYPTLPGDYTEAALTGWNKFFLHLAGRRLVKQVYSTPIDYQVMAIDKPTLFRGQVERAKGNIIGDS